MICCTFNAEQYLNIDPIFEKSDISYCPDISILPGYFNIFRYEKSPTHLEPGILHTIFNKILFREVK